MDIETRFYSAGVPLAATIALPEAGNEMLFGRKQYEIDATAAIVSALYPAVVLCHGSSRYRNDGLDRLAKVLSEHGIVSLRFDFRGDGDSPVLYRQLPSVEMPYDIFCAINYLESLPFVDRGRIGIAGISLGGAMTIRAAATEPRIRSAVTMASPDWSQQDNPISRYGERADEIMEMLLEDARVNAATGISRVMNRMSLNRVTSATPSVNLIEALLIPGNGAYVTLEGVRDMLNLCPLDFAPGVKCPILLTHGQLDTLIPPKCAQMLYDAIPTSTRKEVRIYPDIDHNMPIHKNREPLFSDIAAWFAETM